MALYLDTSALVKLVVDEAETEAVRDLLDDRADEVLVSSALTRCELVRAVRRGAPARLSRALAVLAGLREIAVSTTALNTAASLDPAGLRSLDAVHLASALQLGLDLAGLVTYDLRLAEAATQRGLPVLAPS